ncbi:hypothetical protein SNEBB_002228 [Seison nebaliae]|nr:hypothetical protein SNEBB_002228 [Seison nebaliae]
MINEDFFIDNLKQKNLSNKDYKSILVKNNEKIHLRLVDLPLGKALKLNTKPSVTKVNYTSYHNKHCKQEGLGLFRRLWDSTTKFFENYDARKLKGPLSWDLLDSLSFDWRGRVTPRQPSSITTYNPMSYWPLIPKEEDMCNKAGKPYDIFIFQEVYENLLELDTTVNNPLLLP